MGKLETNGSRGGARGGRPLPLPSNHHLGKCSPCFQTSRRNLGRARQPATKLPDHCRARRLRPLHGACQNRHQGLRQLRQSCGPAHHVAAAGGAPWEPRCGRVLPVPARPWLVRPLQSTKGCNYSEHIVRMSAKHAMVGCLTGR